jgi:hypothetical protein
LKCHPIESNYHFEEKTVPFVQHHCTTDSTVVPNDGAC